MAETFRTLYTGERINNDGFLVDEELKEHPPIRIGNVTLTGTQILALNTTPQVVVGAVTGKRALPVRWCVEYDFNTAAFITNLDVQLLDSVNRNVFGTATNAISGTADKLTTGTILSIAVDTSSGLEVQVASGDPANGNASASIKIKVWYVLV